MEFDRIGVVGTGSWGTALAVILADHGLPVTLWGRNTAVVEGINRQRVNDAYLPGVEIPPNVTATTRMEEVVESGLMVIVCPSRGIRDVCGLIASAGPREGAVAVCCTKGIEFGTGLLMEQVVASVLTGCRTAVLSGPNLAIEIAHRAPAATVVGSSHAEVLEPLQRIFSVKGFRPYTSDDVIGIQLGGALKNVYAIAAGVSDGFGMGDNAKAALVTRSLAEMTRLGVALGGRRETFYGLSGVGDLMVTCFSGHSRNRSLGEHIGKGGDPAELIASMRTVAEGVPTALAALEQARRFGIDAPVAREIHAVIHEGRSPKESLQVLMGRPPKPESESARVLAGQ
jgi:glycerol-3-phosphate dehydrogenase (NAD(P)+)